MFQTHVSMRPCRMHPSRLCLTWQTWKRVQWQVGDMTKTRLSRSIALKLRDRGGNHLVGHNDGTRMRHLRKEWGHELPRGKNHKWFVAPPMARWMKVMPIGKPNYSSIWGFLLLGIWMFQFKKWHGRKHKIKNNEAGDKKTIWVCWSWYFKGWLGSYIES